MPSLSPCSSAGAPSTNCGSTRHCILAEPLDRQTLGEQHELGAGMLPVFLHHGTTRHLAIAAALVEPARTRIGVSDDDAHPAPARLAGQLLGEAQQRGAIAF